jgi:predicted nucleic acid-binding protein
VLAVEHAGLLTAAFENDWHESGGSFEVVAVRSAVLDAAARLTSTRGLRAYDAVQLASALAARAADASIQLFACFDEDLRAAAAQDGFLVDLS